MYKICFTVPESHCEHVKAAIFKAGAGKQDDYEQCAFQIKGQGQFRALKGSNPFIGKIGEIETIVEIRVETMCENHCIKDVVKALKESHPYESPAYDVWKLENI